MFSYGVLPLPPLATGAGLVAAETAGGDGGGNPTVAVVPVPVTTATPAPGLSAATIGAAAFFAAAKAFPTAVMAS